MEHLANAFSALNVDVEDDDEIRGAPSTSKATEDTSGKRDKANNSDNVEMADHEYKMPLVWIDLEMTGLNVEVDRILEIACIVTDGRLTKSIEGAGLLKVQLSQVLGS